MPKKITKTAKNKETANDAEVLVKENEIVIPIDQSRVVLEARRAFLLNLLETMKTNNFRDVSNIEVALSGVNRDLSLL